MTKGNFERTSKKIKPKERREISIFVTKSLDSLRSSYGLPLMPNNAIPTGYGYDLIGWKAISKNKKVDYYQSCFFAQEYNTKYYYERGVIELYDKKIKIKYLIGDPQLSDWMICGKIEHYDYKEHFEYQVYVNNKLTDSLNIEDINKMFKEEWK